MTPTLIALTVWVALSIPVAVLAARTLRRRNAMARHPSSRSLRAGCGHLLYGADVGDLLAVEIQHAWICDFTREEA